MGTLPEAVLCPADDLLQTYVKEGIPVHTGPFWLIQEPDNAIGFIRGDMHQRVQYGFSILLSAADAVQIFGEKLKLYHILAVS